MADVEEPVQAGSEHSDVPANTEEPAAGEGGKGEAAGEEQGKKDDKAVASEEESSSSSDEDSSEAESDESDGHKDRLAAIRAQVLACEEEEEVRASSNDIPRTKNEVTVDAVEPVVEEIAVELDPEETLMEIGRVSSIVSKVIVVSGTPDKSALAEDSVLFLQSRTPVGKIWETFGPVRAPHYSVRFNTIPEGLEVGCAVYIAHSHAKFILAQDMAQMQVRGSDASNMHDEEVAPNEQDFSDDEQEQEFKKNRKALKRQRDGDHPGSYEHQDGDKQARMGGKGKGGKGPKGGKGKGKGYEGKGEGFGFQGKGGMWGPPDMSSNFHNYQLPPMNEQSYHHFPSGGVPMGGMPMEWHQPQYPSQQGGGYQQGYGGKGMGPGQPPQYGMQWNQGQHHPSQHMAYQLPGMSEYSNQAFQQPPMHQQHHGYIQQRPPYGGPQHR